MSNTQFTPERSFGRDLVLTFTPSVRGIRALCRKHRRDIRIVVLLFAACAVAGMVYTSTVAMNARGYPDRYGPAIALALGRGYFQPDVSKSVVLQEFLAQRIDSFSPEQVPADLPMIAPTQFQESWRYFMYFIAAFWKVFGISWSILTLVAGLFFSVAVVSVYCIGRLAMNRAFAFASAVLFAMAPFHVSMVSSLRDYSKTPFLLFAIFLTACLVKLPYSRTRLWRISLLAGVVLGVGAGFRFDMILGVPMFLLTIAAFLPVRLTREAAAKAVAVCFFLGAYYVSGLGLKTAGGTENTSHIIIQGMMTPYDTQVGIERPFYDFGYAGPVDAAAWAVAADYNRRALGSEEPLAYVTEEHARVAFQYLFAVAQYFPADFLTRSYAGINTVLDEAPFGEYYVMTLEHVGKGYQSAEGYRDSTGHLLQRRVAAPKNIDNEFLLSIYAIRARVFAHLHGWGVWIVAVAAFALLVMSPRAGLFAVALVLYFCGVLFLQFDIRNTFHLQWITYFALCFLVYGVTMPLFSPVWRHGAVTLLRDVRTLRLAVFRGAIIGLAVITGLVAPLAALRTYQKHRLLELFSNYEKAPLEPLQAFDAIPLEYRQRTEGTIALQFGDFGRPDRLPFDVTPALVHAEYLVVELNAADSAEPQSAHFIARFGSTVPKVNDGTRAFDIELMPRGTVAPTRVFIPVLYYDASVGQSARFEALEVPAADLRHIKNVYRVTDLSQLPFLLGIVLPPDWRSLPLCERIMTSPDDRRNWMLGIEQNLRAWRR